MRAQPLCLLRFALSQLFMAFSTHVCPSSLPPPYGTVPAPLPLPCAQAVTLNWLDGVALQLVPLPAVVGPIATPTLVVVVPIATPTLVTHVETL